MEKLKNSSALKKIAGGYEAIARLILSELLKEHTPKLMQEVESGYALRELPLTIHEDFTDYKRKLGLQEVLVLSNSDIEKMGFEFHRFVEPWHEKDGILNPGLHDGVKVYQGRHKGRRIMEVEDND